MVPTNGGTTHLQKLYNVVSEYMTSPGSTLLIMSCPSKLNPKLCIHLSPKLYKSVSLLSKALKFLYFQRT